MNGRNTNNQLFLLLCLAIGLSATACLLCFLPPSSYAESNLLCRELFTVCLQYGFVIQQNRATNSGCASFVKHRASLVFVGVIMLALGYYCYAAPPAAQETFKRIFSHIFSSFFFFSLRLSYSHPLYLYLCPYSISILIFASAVEKHITVWDSLSATSHQQRHPKNVSHQFLLLSEHPRAFHPCMNAKDYVNVIKDLH
jgi:hypothetical protein